MKSQSLIMLLIVPTLLVANTINVPVDFSTIQAGLNAANTGDTVFVSAGTYYENNIEWPLISSIKLIGEDRETTIVDGSNDGNIFIVVPPSGAHEDNILSPSTHISGFTIQNGNANGSSSSWADGPINKGAAIYTRFAYITLNNLNIRNNHSNSSAALYMNGSNRVENEVISFDNLNFENNTCGVSYAAAEITITDEGLVGETSFTLTNSNFINNIALAGECGGLFIYSMYNEVSIRNCSFIGNSSVNEKSALYISNSAINKLTLSNSLFVGNSGGGSQGRTIFAHNLTIINTIIYNNGSDLNEVLNLASYSSNISNYEFLDGICHDCTEMDPMFTDPGSGDYTLLPESPLVDAGTAWVEYDGEVIFDLSPEDYAGFAPDIGPGETSQMFIYDPVLLSVEDVPEDQGGKVFVDFQRSFYDREGLLRSGSYQLEIFESGQWVGVATQMAYNDSIYRVLVNTISDSSSSSNGIYDYRVIASMDEGNFVSDTVAGYSVDNIAPFAPQELSFNFSNGNLNASWVSQNNTDLYYWEIYKDGELFQQTGDHSFTDIYSSFGEIHAYNIRGVDINENIGVLSEPFEISNGILGDVTWGDGINVLDATSLIYMIIHPELEFTDGEIWAADMNNDDAIDITDLPLIVDIIMGGTLSELEYEAGPTHLEIVNNILYLSTVEPVVGIQLKLNASSDIQNISTLSMMAANEHVALYSISDEVLMGNNIPLIQLPDGIGIDELIITNHLGESLQPTLGVDQDDLLPNQFAVHPNYPNPFNPSTTLPIDLKEATHLNVTVFNIKAEKVYTIVDSEMLPGYHRFEWDSNDHLGKPVSSGIYLLRVTTPEEIKVIKATLLR